jgi:hypothetical protein
MPIGKQDFLPFLDFPGACDEKASSFESVSTKILGIFKNNKTGIRH